MKSELTCDVAIREGDHDRLMAHLYPSDGDEYGAVLRAGVVSCGDGLRLLVNAVEPARVGTDYVPGKYGYRALAPTFIHRQIVRCRDERMAYLAVHNHGSDTSVRFSRVDMESHERGYPALRDIGKGVPVGALVFGRRAVAADIWMPDGARRALGSYRIVGRTIRRLYANPQRAAKAGAGFDRQVRMFGNAGQAVLGASKVAVVGLGGVGSLVAEYLARLGVGQLVLVDLDVIEDTNLSRVVGATSTDVETGQFKTQIAVRHLREARPDIRLEAIRGDVANDAIAKKLRDCDFIFLAADSMRGRLVVNALVHQYLIPAVQMGAKIRAGAGGLIEEAMCAVRQLRPGMGCLWCNGLIDGTQLAIEAKTDEERKAQDYGVREPDPSVITLNAVAAGQAVNDFLFDFLDLRSEGGDAVYQHHHFLRHAVQKVVPRKDSNCRECGRRLGMGDAMELPTVTV